MSGVKLATLTATGKPVELTRFTGAFKVLMLQFTADTGYVQVGVAELLRVLHNPKPVEEIDPWRLLEAAHRELIEQLPNDITIELGGIARLASKLGEMLEARKRAMVGTT